MNPRQRRGVLLLALAGLGLVGVFALVAGYVADVRAEVDPKVRVLALTKQAPPFEAITDDMVETIELPRRWAPPNALRDPGQLVGVVPASRLADGTILQEGTLVAPPALGSGQRELAILVDAETGVAGKIGPGAIVDIIATFARDEDREAESRVVVPRARVVEVGEVSAAEGRSAQAPNLPAQNLGFEIPVTFALTPDQALNVTFAESFATEVRLALRRPGDLSPLSNDQKVFRRSEARP